MHHEEKQPFSWKHTLGSTLAWWYTVVLGWTTRIYWFKTEEAKKLEEQKAAAKAEEDAKRAAEQKAIDAHRTDSFFCLFSFDRILCTRL